jgi:5-methylcytosine-specific restriction endonuclease McrA
MLTRLIVEQCYIRDGWKCRHCNSRGPLHPHHIIYRSAGGPDELWNVITLCAFCHGEGIHKANLKIVEPADANRAVIMVRRLGWKPQ